MKKQNNANCFIIAYFTVQYMTTYRTVIFARYVLLHLYFKSSHRYMVTCDHHFPQVRHQFVSCFPVISSQIINRRKSTQLCVLLFKQRFIQPSAKRSHILNRIQVFTDTFFNVCFSGLLLIAHTSSEVRRKKDILFGIRYTDRSCSNNRLDRSN